MTAPAAAEPTAPPATPAPADAGPPAVRRGAVAAAALVTVVCWASAFVAIRALHGEVRPGALALGRLLVGGAALTAAVVARRRWVSPTRAEWWRLVVCGASWFAVYNVALGAAERRVDAGTAAMLVNVGPVLIALLAGAVLGEGFPRWLLVGAVVALGGAALIAAATTQHAGADVTGVLLCLLAAATWAVGVTAQKPVLRRLPALQVTQLACLVGAACCLPFAGQLVTDLGRAPARAALGVAYLGLVPTAVAFGTWAFALARVPAGRLGVTTYLVPPLTVLLAWPLLGETPPGLALVGGLVALTGVALTRLRR